MATIPAPDQTRMTGKQIATTVVVGLVGIQTGELAEALLRTQIHPSMARAAGYFIVFSAVYATALNWVKQKTPAERMRVVVGPAIFAVTFLLVVEVVRGLL